MASVLHLLPLLHGLTLHKPSRDQISVREHLVIRPAAFDSINDGKIQEHILPESDQYSSQVIFKLI